MSQAEANVDSVFESFKEQQQHAIDRLQSLDPHGPKFAKVDGSIVEGVTSICYILERTDLNRDVTDPPFAPIERAGLVATLVKNRQMPPGMIPPPGSNIDVEMPQEGLTFDAAHISLMVHPRSPHAPVCHVNRRFIQVYKNGQKSGWWFGGASTLTPILLYDEDCVSWHKGIKSSTLPWTDVYDPMKKWCDEYFYNPYFEEVLGIGGIFFDNLGPQTHTRLDINEPNTKRPKSYEECLKFCTSTMKAHWDEQSYLKILRERAFLPWTKEERDHQLTQRGRFIDHFLAVEIGFRFGLGTKSGSLEGMRLLLPQLAQWVHVPNQAPTVAKAIAQIAVFKKPRDWI